MPIQKSADVKLFELARELSLAKSEEAKATLTRVSVEEKIIKLTGFKLKSGSVTFPATCSGGSTKLVLKQPVSVSVDEDGIPKLKKELGRGLFGKLFKLKHSIVAKELKVLEEADKEKFLLAKKALISKPGKIGVELKILEVL